LRIARPGSWWKNNKWTRGLREPSQVVTTIICVNIGIYLLSLLLSTRASFSSFSPFSSYLQATASCCFWGQLGPCHRPVPAVWTLVSASYLHGGALHIAFNMMALNQLGHLYFKSSGLSHVHHLHDWGACGFLVSYWARVPFTVGASAPYAPDRCSLYYGKSREGYGQAIYRQVGGGLGIFLFGILVPVSTTGPTGRIAEVP